MKRAFVLLLLVSGFVFPCGVFAQGRDEMVVVPADQHVVGDVSTISQNILIAGEVSGDVTSWSGDITVSGRVGGDVVSYAGQVKIIASGSVGGNILVLGGAPQVERSGQVVGWVISGEERGGALASILDLLVPPSGGFDDTGVVARRLFGVTLGVLLFAFCLLWLLFWPQRTTAAGLTLRRLPGRALLLGLLATIVLVLLLPGLAALLAATLIGLPLLILLFVLLHLVFVCGLATLVRAIGTLAGQGYAQNISSTAVVSALLIVALIAVTAMIAPLWGLMLFYVVALPGFGALLLSRGGLLVPIRS